LVLAHHRRGPFRDFLTAPPVCKSLFKSVLDFSLAEGGRYLSVSSSCFFPEEKPPCSDFQCFDVFGPHADVAVATRIQSIHLPDTARQIILTLNFKHLGILGVVR
jgi:hypothetical protein